MHYTPFVPMIGGAANFSHRNKNCRMAEMFSHELRCFGNFDGSDSVRMSEHDKHKSQLLQQLEDTSDFSACYCSDLEIDTRMGAPSRPFSSDHVGHQHDWIEPHAKAQRSLVAQQIRNFAAANILNLFLLACALIFNLSEALLHRQRGCPGQR